MTKWTRTPSGRCCGSILLSRCFFDYSSRTEIAGVTITTRSSQTLRAAPLTRRALQAVSCNCGMRRRIICTLDADYWIFLSRGAIVTCRAGSEVVRHARARAVEARRAGLTAALSPLVVVISLKAG